MRDQDPMKNMISSDKTWHNEGPDVISFINRDKKVSESVPAPSVEYPLGNMYTDRLSRLRGEQFFNIYMDHDDETGTDYYPTWMQSFDYFTTPPTENSRSIPGIIAYEIEPVFGMSPISKVTGGYTDLRQQSNQTDRFINYWSKLRLFNNQTRDVQPGDIQTYIAELMNIFGHVANLRRILNVFKSAQMSSTSAYNSPEALATALGWPMKEFTMRKNITQWINIFNRDILGNLRNVVTFKDIVPGMMRWAGLFSRIYKDTSADTDYCQLAVIVPASAWKVENEIGAGGDVRWAFRRETEKVLWHYGGPSSPTSEWVQAFERYLAWVADQIRSFYYDDSTATIAALLNTVLQRSSSAASELGIMKVDVGEDMSHTPEAVSYTWDYKMMLALHNATIVNIVNAGAFVRSADGVLVQQLATSDTITNASYLHYAPKVINLPCFGPTNSDIANATQWTYIGDTTQYNVKGYDPQSGDQVRRDVNPLSIGTDYIAAARIYSFGYHEASGMLIMKCTDFCQAVHPAGDAWEDGNPDTYATVRGASAFAFAPILYWMDTMPLNSQWAQQFGVESLKVITDFSTTDVEVIYSIGFETLAEVHRAWQNNFWGYPIEVRDQGTPDLTGDTK